MEGYIGSLGEVEHVPRLPDMGNTCSGIKRENHVTKLQGSKISCNFIPLLRMGAFNNPIPLRSRKRQRL